ncbi:hypothetical protein POV27_05920 [Aureisphaera galaxeae]|uniref:hypothetical protein n=1 Tax=Aureisphaera galaxeae TaxID=1538023 RepID=UPI0023502379|nr:hypothetical protein [Aureisphaera galaxeae]MDC8003579.1 hypothetical protein [Aureisphaera galaxeae]
MKTILTLAFILGYAMMFGQNTYLKIYKDESRSDQTAYPPGTRFEVRDADNNLLFDQDTAQKTFKVERPVTLVVYPNYKESQDIFPLSEGIIEQALTSDFFPTQNKDTSYGSHGVTVRKELTDSKKKPGSKNLKLTLSNGIIFQYQDGTAFAELNGKELTIKNKYIIYSDLGILKLSFGPKSGTVWWVFEPKG